MRRLLYKNRLTLSPKPFAIFLKSTYIHASVYTFVSVLTKTSIK